MKTIPLRKILLEDKLIRPNLTKIVKRYESYTCGIPPLPQRLREPPPPPHKFPDDLVRPPCYPGQTVARVGPCGASMAGYYCPSDRTKYTYPPFSENIDFIPGTSDCWWAVQPRCDLNIDDEKLPFRPQ